MITQQNSRGRLARVLVAAAVPIIAAAGLASTAAAAEPQRGAPAAVAPMRAVDRDDYYWCYFRSWYPCYEHDRYHDWDWGHHQHHGWDHDHDRH